jgi:hypothetical protein
VAHISLVFREMWDSNAFSSKRSIQRKLAIVKWRDLRFSSWLSRGLCSPCGNAFLLRADFFPKCLGFTAEDQVRMAAFLPSIDLPQIVFRVGEIAGIGVPGVGLWPD